MTKDRRPLTFEDALHRVAGTLGMDTAAEVIGRTPTTLYQLMNPDHPSGIRLDQALQLDLESLRLDGSTPLFDVYAGRIIAAEETSTQECPSSHAAKLARGSGHAIASLITAATGTPMDARTALDHVDDMLSALVEARRSLARRAGLGPVQRMRRAARRIVDSVKSKADAQ